MKTKLDYIRKTDYLRNNLDLRGLYTPIKNIYTIKYIHYGRFIDFTLFKNPQLSYENANRSFTRKPFPKRSARNLKRSRDNIYRLAQANADYYRSTLPIFATFKYARNNESLSRTYADFKYFIGKLRKVTGTKVQYIAIPEIQKKRLERTGFAVWHLHVILFNCPFVPVKIVEKLWGHGRDNQGVDFQVAREIGSTASYLLKYIQKDQEEIRLRGQRSQLTSRGLIRPTISFDECEFDELIKDVKLQIVDIYENQKLKKINYKII